MKKILRFVCLILVISAGSAQASNVEGYVFEKVTQEPLQGVSMYYGCGGQSNQGGVTDSNGFYNITLTNTSGTGCGVTAVAVLGSPNPTVSVSSSLGNTIESGKTYSRNFYLSLNADWPRVQLVTSKAEYAPGESVDILLRVTKNDGRKTFDPGNFNAFSFQITQGSQVVQTIHFDKFSLQTNFVNSGQNILYRAYTNALMTPGVYSLTFIAAYPFSDYYYQMQTSVNVASVKASDETLAAISNVNGNVATIQTKLSDIEKLITQNNLLLKSVASIINWLLKMRTFYYTPTLIRS